MRHTFENHLHRPLESSGKSAAKKSNKSETPTWTSDVYIDKFLHNPNYETREKQVAALKEDILHLLQEVNLVQPVTSYDYWLNLEAATFTTDSYQESMDELHSNFVEHLQKSNFQLGRAITEHLTIHNVSQVLAQEVQTTANPSTCFLITSAPDLKEYGYHGSDSLEKNNWKTQESHHTFFYILVPDDIQRDAQGTVTKVHISATQYRTWHNLDQLIALHQQLGQPITSPTPETITQELFANVVQFDQANFASIEHLQEYIASLLYADAATWKFNPDQAPIMPEGINILNEALELFDTWYAPTFLDLLHSVPDRTQLNEKLNHLFDFYFRAVEKRIRETNINPAYPPHANKGLKHSFSKLLTKLKKKPADTNSADSTNPTNTLPQQLFAIQNIYQQDQHFRFSGTKFSRAQRLAHLKNVGNVIEISNFAFGSAQCLLFTPFTLPMTAMRLGFNPAALTGFSGSLSELSVNNLQKLSSELQKSNYQEISFRDGNKTITYMVPKSYGDGCYLKDGLVYGPCNIPLTDDPLALQLTASEFAQYLQLLQNTIDEKSSISDTTQLLETTNLDPLESQELQLLYKNIVDQLCKKTVSVDELINNDVVECHSDIPEILHHLHLLLKNSANPLQTLLQFTYSGRLNSANLRV